MSASLLPTKTRFRKWLPALALAIVLPLLLLGFLLWGPAVDTPDNSASEVMALSAHLVVTQENPAPLMTLSEPVATEISADVALKTPSLPTVTAAKISETSPKVAAVATAKTQSPIKKAPIVLNNDDAIQQQHVADNSKKVKEIVNIDSTSTQSVDKSIKTTSNSSNRDNKDAIIRVRRDASPTANTNTGKSLSTEPAPSITDATSYEEVTQEAEAMTNQLSDAINEIKLQAMQDIKRVEREKRQAYQADNQRLSEELRVTSEQLDIDAEAATAFDNQ